MYRTGLVLGGIGLNSQDCKVFAGFNAYHFRIPGRLVRQGDLGLIASLMT